MQKFFRTIYNEWRDIFTHASVFMVMIVGILLYSVLYPLPYLEQVAQQLPVIVIDQDNTPASRQLIRYIDSTEGASILKQGTSTLFALEELKEGVASGVLVIGTGFGKELLRGGEFTLSFYVDAGYLLKYKQAYKGVKQAVELYAAGVRVERFQAMGMPRLSALSVQRRGTIAVNTLYNPAASYLSNTVPAVFVLILQQTLIIGAALLTIFQRKREKENFAEQSSFFTLLGRSFSHVILYALIALYYFTLLPVLFDLPMVDNIFELLFFLIPFFLSASFLGMLLGSFLEEEESALVVILPLSIPLLFLSGFTFPLDVMPVAIQFLAAFIPSTAAINGYLLLAFRSASFGEILSYWVQLWGLAFIFFSILYYCKNKVTLKKLL